MPCYHPIQAYYSKTLNETGKRSLVFNPSQALESDNPLEIACGRCIGCRLEKSRQWAIRCVHEASLHDENCFLTLTFSPEAMEKRPNQWSLNVRDFQLFMKKLRKKYKSTKQNQIRFFHCGEYGDENKRPHYHAIIFNHNFKDKKQHSVTKNGHPLYISEELSKLWPDGFATIGEVNFETAAYVARYCMKKITGDKADEHYTWLDENGEYHPLKPEYTTMSRRPGIGKKWFDKYKHDLYPKDFITINGKKNKPPKFYDKQLEKHFIQEYEALKDKRINQADPNHPDYSLDRMEVRKKCKELQIKQLTRNHDKGEH